jgi:hypothetical protein
MNIRLWLFRLITWDGVLPVVVWTSPFLIRLILPNDQRALELAIVIIPAMSLVVRIYAGMHFINRNNCAVGFRILQMRALCVGTFLLLFIDLAFLFQTHIAPKGVRVVNPVAQSLCSAVLAIYLLSMAVAVYPGPSNSDLRESYLE